MNEKLKISIGDYSVEIPNVETSIDETFAAIISCLELYGWHKETIKDWIVEYSQEIDGEKEKDNG